MKIRDDQRGAAMCLFCRFWRADFADDDSGECRRYAPRSMLLNITSAPLDMQVVVDWPATRSIDECGEFQPSPQFKADFAGKDYLTCNLVKEDE